MASLDSKVAPFLSTTNVVIFPISTFSVMYFFHGTYIFVFGTYLYMMRNRDQGPDITTTKNKLYLALTILLFGLSTIYVGVYTYDNVDFTIVLFDVATKDYQPAIELTLDNVKGTVITLLEWLIPVLLNITAEWMLIHRCYTIWSFDKRIGYPLILGSIIVNGIDYPLFSTSPVSKFPSRMLATGIIAAILESVGFNMEGPLFSQAGTIYASYTVGSTVFNLILTLLTAGRIWWIHRQIRAHGIHTSDRLIGSVCRIVLESGIIYPLFQICGLIESNTMALESVPFNFIPISTLSAAFAPTLIMVRAKLGKNVESLQTGHLSDIQFGNRPEPTTTTTDAQVQSLNTVPTEVVEYQENSEGRMI